ncbi:MAG: hypothetical protein KGZ96_06660 [Clostridia bacterium]|nr:hypothetical protein [Clostridia bacterium]
MVDRINLDFIDKEIYKIGLLKKDIINLLGLNLMETEIIIWKDRLKYIEKHKNDFKTESDYKKHVES